MEPLHDATALELLKRHTHVLQHKLVIEWHSTDEFSSAQLKLCVRSRLGGGFVSPGSDRKGAAMRLAIDALNTLCACEGFGVDENPRFWRRVLVEWLLAPLSSFSDKWWEEQQLPLLSARLFSLYDFALMPYLQEPDATLFWRELILISTWGEDHRATRSELQRMLDPYIVRPVRPLHLFVPIRFAAASTGGDDQYTWENAKRRAIIEVCRELHEQQQERPDPSMPTSVTVHLQVIVSTTLQPPFEWVSSGIDALNTASPPLCIEEVVFGDRSDGHPQDLPWSQRVASTSRFTTMVQSVPRLSVVDFNSEPRTYGAYASLIPHSNSLRQVKLSLIGRRFLLEWAWVLYALYHPSRRDATKPLESLNLDVGKALNENELEYMEHIVRNGLPLRDVVLENLHPDRLCGCYHHEEIDCFAFGATVMVLADQWLYYSPHDMDLASHRAVQLDRTLELDLIAHVPIRGWVAVVYPGWGLLWTTTTAVCWTDARGWRAYELPGREIPMGQLMHCCALELRLEKCSGKSKPCKRRRTETAMPTSPLPLFLDPTLQSLTLWGHSPLTETDLEFIVTACPQLKRLELRDCKVKTLAPLVTPTASPLTALRVGWKLDENEFGTAYGQRQQQPPPVESDLYAPVISALCSSGHPLVHSLRELDVALAEPTYADSTLTRLRGALLLPTTRLESVTIRCHLASSVVVEQFALFHDQVLVDPVEVALLLLGVLSRFGIQAAASDAARQQRGEQSIGRLVVLLVGQFTGGPARRHLRVLDMP